MLIFRAFYPLLFILLLVPGTNFCSAFFLFSEPTPIHIWIAWREALSPLLLDYSNTAAVVLEHPFYLFSGFE